MKHYFDFIVKRMSRKYEKIEDKGITYFLKDGKAVATKEGNLLNLYFDAEANVVWNHYERVVVSIAKNFKIVTNMEVKRAEVIAIKGLCGVHNSIKLVKNMYLDESQNFKLTLKEEKAPKEKPQEPWEIIDYGVRDQLIAQNVKFDHATFDVTIRDAAGKTFKVPYTEGIGLSIEDKILVGCIGHIFPDRGNYVVYFSDFNFYLTLNKHMKDKRLNTNLYVTCYYENRRSRKRKRKIQKKDQIYSYLRKENEWHWNAGKNNVGTPAMKAEIDRTRRTNWTALKRVHLVRK